MPYTSLRLCRFLAVFAILFGQGVTKPAAAQEQQADASRNPPTVRRLAFSPDGQSLAVIHNVQNSLVVWDVSSRQRRFMIREKGALLSVAYEPHGTLLAIGAGPDIKLLDPQTGELHRELKGHAQKLRSMAFTPDGKQLVTGSDDRTIKIWNLDSGETTTSIAESQSAVYGVVISPDGKWMAATNGDNEPVRLWRWGKFELPARKIDTRGGFVPQVAFTPDSQFLVIPSWLGSVTMIDVTSGAEAERLSNVGGVNCTAFTGDGTFLALLAHDSAIDLISYRHVPTDTERKEIEALIRQFDDDDYSKREAATRALIKYGMTALDQLRAQLDSHSPEVRIRCRRLIQRLESARSATKLIGHKAETNWGAFSPDDKILASGDKDGVVKLWDISKAKEIATLTPND